MMNKQDNIETLFEDLKGKFDVLEPNKGHGARFLEKLDAKSSGKKENKLSTFWKPLLAVAASVVIAISVFGGINQTEDTLDLASVSPEFSEAQDFFTTTISEELKKLNAERSPLTENIIYEAERQLKTLEEDYEDLKNDLKESGNDKRVIYAMISNFQSRIDILNDILDKIEDLKDTNYDTENTL
ncbi:hypothetical protein [Winogradskyella jejuensis]|uniref:DUF4179 domain-containing protein n=1 Tax=Winogradskyella jejuensis TaxID=1089305 RepID=A0A1M5TI31_9FLAO|nr:hypothetical protein [Winogradskyella jejuensis]SHH50321.1 hypothetical protein SAMN05444148_2174 [Winogradskyella jejuensis]